MEQLLASRASRLLMAIIAVAVIAVTPRPASAIVQTPDTCDQSGPKYYCAHVDYDTDWSTLAYNISRWYLGAIDGGAKWWQRMFITDWQWNGSTWQQVANYGEGPWYNNVPFSFWESVNPGNGGGNIAQPAAVTMAIRYTDRRNFRSTVLEHSAIPNAVGMTGTFDGRTTVHRRPGFPDRVTTWGPGELTVPDDWLVPGGIDGLVKTRGYTMTSAGNGTAAVSREETVRAVPPPPGREAAAAPPQREHRVRKETTYRQANGIPIRLIETIDGVEVRRAEVEDLQVRSR